MVGGFTFRLSAFVALVTSGDVRDEAPLSSLLNVVLVTSDRPLLLDSYFVAHDLVNPHLLRSDLSTIYDQYAFWGCSGAIVLALSLSTAAIVPSGLRKFGRKPSPLR